MVLLRLIAHGVLALVDDPVDGDVRLVHLLERVFSTRFMDASVYLMSDLPAHVEARDVALIAGTAFVLCCLSTVYPAWRAATTHPARALRHD